MMWGWFTLSRISTSLRSCVASGSLDLSIVLRAQTRSDPSNRHFRTVPKLPSPSTSFVRWYFLRMSLGYPPPKTLVVLSFNNNALLRVLLLVMALLPMMSFVPESFERTLPRVSWGFGSLFIVCVFFLPYSNVFFSFFLSVVVFLFSRLLYSTLLYYFIVASTSVVSSVSLDKG